MRAAALVWLALLAGCGFLPEDDFTGKRVGDGIAPWTDLGPVQVCLGSESLGPPTSTPGGFCSDVNTAEAPCASDGDCRSRESCMCGRCTVAYCTATSDCGGERICTFNENRCDVVCANAFDCADAEECFNGTCRGRCFTDAECQSGEVCNSENYCITVDCDADSACQSSERCKVQRVPRLALEPSALPGDDATRVVLWLELGDEAQPSRRHVWRAVSRNGRTFRIDPAVPVLDDGLDTRAPSVIRTSKGFAMYYEWNDGAEIRVATSADGRSFTGPTKAIAGGTGAAAARAPTAVLLAFDGSRLFRRRAWHPEVARLSLAALFAEDGFVLPSGALPVRGRAAIEKHYTGSGGPLSLRALAYATEGSIGYIIGAYGGERGKPDSGKFTLTLKKGPGDRWLIMSDMDNVNARRPPTP